MYNDECHVKTFRPISEAAHSMVIRQHKLLLTTDPTAAAAAVWYRTIINTLSCRTSLWSASYVGCQRNTARICCWAPAICRCLLPAGRSAANPRRRPFLQSSDGTDRQMDRQTDAKPFHDPAPHTRASPTSDRLVMSIVCMSEDGRAHAQIRTSLEWKLETTSFEQDLLKRDARRNKWNA